MPTLEDLVLRTAETEDLHAITEVADASRTAAGTAMPSADRAADDPGRQGATSGPLDPDAREVWVAQERGIVVGFATVTPSWLEDLYVAPAAQGRGVGTALLDTVKALRPHGFGLWVYAANDRARGFYARRGLIELETTDGADHPDGAPEVQVVWPGADPLAYLRRRINGVDEEVAVLLGRRFALTAAVQDHKPVGGFAGRDPARERAILERLRARAPGVPGAALTRVLQVVIEESLHEWEASRDDARVASEGPAGLP